MALALWHNRQFSSYRGPPACAAISKCAQIQSLGQDTPTQASVRARRPDPLSGAPPPPFHARVEASKSRIFRVGIERPSEDLAALGGGPPAGGPGGPTAGIGSGGAGPARRAPVPARIWRKLLRKFAEASSPGGVGWGAFVRLPFLALANLCLPCGQQGDTPGAVCTS